MNEERKILESLSEEKVLGVVWDHEKDTFLYKEKADVHQTRSENRPETTSKLTKRRILSQIARIFDPIGFVSAFLVRAKIGMQ